VSDYYDVLAEFQAQSKDPNWCSICWAPLGQTTDCPDGHISAQEKVDNPISSDQRTKDLEMRNAGMERKSAAYKDMARAKGYADMEALYAGEKAQPVQLPVEPEVNPL
jgi:hypothetical protein